MEDSTNYAWSYFSKEKSELKDVMMFSFKDLKATYDVDVRYVCCDNAGKNEAFEGLCKQKGMSVNFEHTAPHK